jgi:spermidine synthase
MWPFKNFIFAISFIFLGFFSLIIQTLFLREIIATFYGHEFLVGIILSAWLIWVAFGSLITQKFKKSKRGFFLLPSLLGFLLFLEIFLLRYLKQYLGFAGEVPNLLLAILLSIFLPLPLCFLLGSWWTLFLRHFAKEKDYLSWINKAYFFETLGFVFGGVLFSFLLIYFPTFFLVSLLIVLGFLIVFISFQRSFFKIFLFFFVGVIFLFLFFNSLKSFELLTQSFRFKDQKLLDSFNSKYGNLTITQTKDQKNFYQNGILISSTKLAEITEEKIHLSLLETPLPQKILLIGGGLEGMVNEALKHPLKSIYYLELDPKLLEESQKYLKEEIKKGLSDKKVKIIYQDGFYFLKATKEKFDLIILNLPEPSNILLNRFYTKEFFEITKERITENGILAFVLPYSSTLPNKNLYLINLLIYNNLKKVFPNVLIFSGNSNLFLASKKDILTSNPEILIKRFKKRKIKTKFLTDKYIEYRLLSERNKSVLKSFEESSFSNLNTLKRPLAYFYQILFWLDHFNPKFSNLFKNFISSFFAIFVSALIIFLIFILKKKKFLPSKIACISMGIAGISVMSIELILIFLYQSSVGYLYSRISLLISAIILGMALGTFLGNKLQKKLEKENFLLFWIYKTHLFLALFSLLLLSLLSSIFRFFSIFTEILILILGIFAGILGGFLFPLTNKLYSLFKKEKNTSTIYAADLIGSSFGALIPSLILIPAFGFSSALLFLILINCLIPFYSFLLTKKE